ncbi:MAG: transglycosylase domain-containing protein [Acidimicrobiia bacterium]
MVSTPTMPGRRTADPRPAPRRRRAPARTMPDGHRGGRRKLDVIALAPSPGRRFVRRWLRATAYVCGGIGLALFATAGAVLYWASTVELPDPVPPAQTTFVYDAKGNSLVEFRTEQDRIVVPFGQVPAHMSAAVVAREDRRYFEHSGVDLQGIVRAAWSDLRDKPTQGGSTIPQQYIKNVYLNPDRTFARKAREAVMALKLEQRFSKEEILGMYLNTVYFGRGAYGVEAAARSYFGTTTSQLDVGQSAYLAGILNSPATADPLEHPQEAMRRRNATLGAMVEMGSLDPATAAAIAPAPVVAIAKPERRTVTAAGGSAYFAEYVRRQLVAQFGEDAVYRGGLRVVTTLDPDMQASAEQAARDRLDRDDDPDAAVVTLDSDGRVRAMVGGDDYSQSQVNLAVGREGGGSGRQAGSTFKAIVLAAAFDKGISPRTRYSAPRSIRIPLEDGTSWDVSNAGDAEGGGTVDLMAATAGSINTVFAQLVMDVGPADVVAMAHRLGVTSPLQPVPSIALGAGEVSPLEMAHAYAIIANRGADPGVHLFESVTAPDGTARYQLAPGREQILDEGVADSVTAALSGVVDHGTGTSASIDNGHVAGKTGTTQDYGDAWFVGFTPEFTTAVWVGYKEGRSRPMVDVHGRRVYGGTFPALIFHDHMQRVMETVDAPADLPGGDSSRADAGVSERRRGAGSGGTKRRSGGSSSGKPDAPTSSGSGDSGGTGSGSGSGSGSGGSGSGGGGGGSGGGSGSGSGGGGGGSGGGSGSGGGGSGSGGGGSGGGSGGGGSGSGGSSTGD